VTQDLTYSISPYQEERGSGQTGSCSRLCYGAWNLPTACHYVRNYTRGPTVRGGMAEIADDVIDPMEEIEHAVANDKQDAR
jgi:hypothetical protein